MVLFIRILLLHPEELQRHFEEEAPASAKDPSKYALHLLEYSCFRALSVQAQVTDHLSDKEFRRLTFDMMLAWETPGAADKPVLKVQVLFHSSMSRYMFWISSNKILLQKYLRCSYAANRANFSSYGN